MISGPSEPGQVAPVGLIELRPTFMEITEKVPRTRVKGVGLGCFLSVFERLRYLTPAGQVLCGNVLEVALPEGRPALIAQFVYCRQQFGNGPSG